MWMIQESEAGVLNENISVNALLLYNIHCVKYVINTILRFIVYSQKYIGLEVCIFEEVYN